MVGEGVSVGVTASRERLSKEVRIKTPLRSTLSAGIKLQGSEARQFVASIVNTVYVG